MADVYSTSKLAFHKEKLEDVFEGSLTPPIYARVKPTNACNHNCFFCGYEQDKSKELFNRKDKLDFGKMKELLVDFKEMDVRAVTFSGGGEPLIYPGIEEIADTARDYGIEISLITNGQELFGNKAEAFANSEWVRISCDASDSISFSKSRRVDGNKFFALEDNIRRFAKIKKPECELGINFVVHHLNCERVYYSANFIKNLGANHIKITPSWMPDFLGYHKEIREGVERQIEKARRDFEDSNFKVYDTYKKDFEHCGDNKRSYHFCPHAQIVTIIGADGNVYLCHDRAYSKSGVLGNINNKRFKEVWYSKEASMRFGMNPKEECNRHCANDVKNLTMFELIKNIDDIRKFKPKEDRHKNFI